MKIMLLAENSSLFCAYLSIRQILNPGLAATQTRIQIPAFSVVTICCFSELYQCKWSITQRPRLTKY